LRTVVAWHSEPCWRQRGRGGRPCPLHLQAPAHPRLPAVHLSTHSKLAASPSASAPASHPAAKLKRITSYGAMSRCAPGRECAWTADGKGGGRSHDYSGPRFVCSGLPVRRSTPAGRHKRDGLAARRLQPGSGRLQPPPGSAAPRLACAVFCPDVLLTFLPLLLVGCPCHAAIKAPAIPGAMPALAGPGGWARAPR